VAENSCKLQFVAAFLDILEELSDEFWSGKVRKGNWEDEKWKEIREGNGEMRMRCSSPSKFLDKKMMSYRYSSVCSSCCCCWTRRYSAASASFCLQNA